jgi:hypothetical protein
MNKGLYFVFVSTLSVLLTILAGCADSERFAVAGKAGTLGLGGELSAKVATDINARVGFNTLDLDFDDQEFDEVEYDVGIKLSSFSAIADWHIFDNSFKISGGVISIDNEFDLDGRPTEDVEIGGTTYTPTQVGTLSGQAEIDGLAPYVGIGWGNPFGGKRRWGFTCDFGVAFTDSPDVRLSASNPAVSQADLEQERQDIEDDLDVIRIYPVLSIGLYFRF